VFLGAIRSSHENRTNPVVSTTSVAEVWTHPVPATIDCVEKLGAGVAVGVAVGDAVAVAVTVGVVVAGGVAVAARVDVGDGAIAVAVAVTVSSVVAVGTGMVAVGLGASVGAAVGMVVATDVGKGVWVGSGGTCVGTSVSVGRGVTSWNEAPPTCAVSLGKALAPPAVPVLAKSTRHMMSRQTCDVNLCFMADPSKRDTALLPCVPDMLPTHVVDGRARRTERRGSAVR
jgi:hypothetical protein